MIPTCTYEIHTGVQEFIRKGEVIFTPFNRAKTAPVATPIRGAQDDLELIAPLDDIEDMTDDQKRYHKDKPKDVPLAIVLHYLTPEGEPMWEYTYVSLMPDAKVVRQLVRTKAGVFKVEQLYGGDEEDDDNGAAVAVIAGQEFDGENRDASPATGGVNVVNDDDGDDCVICLTNPKDTAVIPCRHLCLCRDCAGPLQRQSPKCPVCRGPIDQLLHIGKR